MEKRELVIIGAGPAGMAAAIYGRRAGLDVLLLERGATGGQINTTEEIENWPGVQHATGPELVTICIDYGFYKDTYSNDLACIFMIVIFAIRH
jgi:thioredoxin reductase